MNASMQLPVVPTQDAHSASDSEGLRFHCTQCGNCCTGGPGFVWITKEEIVELAKFLKLSPEETVERYCRKIAGQFSLQEFRNPRDGQYDCVFMKDQPATAPANKNTIVQPIRTCSIYPVRPLQCRTFPFWDSNLSSPAAWQAVAKRCPGIGQGRLYSREEIESIRLDAKWPEEE
jgi:Fe-S-cluster containining protein